MDLTKHDGKRVRIKVGHGSTERYLTGKVRSFETEARWDPLTGKQTQETETRWELTGVREDRTHHENERNEPAYDKALSARRYDAVGLVPEDITELEPLT